MTLLNMSQCRPVNKIFQTKSLYRTWSRYAWTIKVSFFVGPTIIFFFFVFWYPTIEIWLFFPYMQNNIYSFLLSFRLRFHHCTNYFRCFIGILYSLESVNFIGLGFEIDNGLYGILTLLKTYVGVWYRHIWLY